MSRKTIDEHIAELRESVGFTRFSWLHHEYRRRISFLMTTRTYQLAVEVCEQEDWKIVLRSNKETEQYFNTAADIMTYIDTLAEAQRILIIMQQLSPPKVRAALEWDKGVRDE